MKVAMLGRGDKIHCFLSELGCESKTGRTRGAERENQIRGGGGGRGKDESWQSQKKL
jgi:hypothetical protein